MAAVYSSYGAVVSRYLGVFTTTGSFQKLVGVWIQRASKSKQCFTIKSTYYWSKQKFLKFSGYSKLWSNNIWSKLISEHSMELICTWSNKSFKAIKQFWSSRDEQAKQYIAAGRMILKQCILLKQQAESVLEQCTCILCSSVNGRLVLYYCHESVLAAQM